MSTKEGLDESELPLDSEEFEDRLIAEIDAFIDEHDLDESRFDEEFTEDEIREGLHTRIYNELAAVDLPRQMIEDVNDEQLFIHLLKQMEDEAKHGRMLAQRIWALGGEPQKMFEKTEGSTKEYWDHFRGRDPIEIGTMMQCGSERMASFRVGKEKEYFDEETAEIYDNVIVPEEQFHAKIVEYMLRTECTDAASQRKALKSSREIRRIIMDKHDEGVREAYSD
jgi:hypothetical protein